MGSGTHPLQIPMNHRLAVDVHQSLRNVLELTSQAIVSDKQGQQRNRNRMSSNRFTSLFSLMYSLMFPPTIHSDIIANWVLSIVTPSSGNTFRWRRIFHVMTSLQNLYGRVIVSLPTYLFTTPQRRPTRVILTKLVVEYTLRTLTAT